VVHDAAKTGEVDPPHHSKHDSPFLSTKRRTEQAHHNTLKYLKFRFSHLTMPSSLLPTELGDKNELFQAGSCIRNPRFRSTRKDVDV
jgi:hypothetical protein